MSHSRLTGSRALDRNHETAFRVQSPARSFPLNGGQGRFSLNHSNVAFKSSDW
jgi:hypothetical protein